MPQSNFTREQVYAIRDLAAKGVSAPRIIQALGLRCALETVRRVIRRDTHAEVGVGAAERPMVSNRLQGEARQAGDPAPAYHPPVPPDLDEQLRRLDALAPKAEPPPNPLDGGDMPLEGADPEAIIAARKAAMPKTAAELIAEMTGRSGHLD